MSVKIRLQRFGKKDKPFFRIVAMEKNNKRDGKTLAIIGHYNPESPQISLDKTELENWLKKGAQPTQTVRKLLSL